MKFLMVFLIAMMTLFTANSIAATQLATKGAEYDLNLASPGAMAKHQLGSLVVSQKKWVLKGTYDFAVQGGAISTIKLRGDDLKELKLPKGAIVSYCAIDVLSALTSGGSATVAVSTGKTAADLKAATAYGSITGLVACVPVGTVATSIKLTADVIPTITVAGAALTGGKFNVLIEYTLSD